MAYRLLHDNWTLSAVEGPIPDEVAGEVIAATVPGCVHTDLLTAGLIVAPFDGDNETHQQWIGSTVWRYETHFDWHDDGSERHDLVADGLDTVATIDVNGHTVATTQNQHRGYRFPVGHLLVEGSNRLTITFASPVAEAEARSEAHGPRPHVNHHPYNALRKSASNFGWDWGIDVATSGIWKAIGLDSWSGVRIASVRPLVDVEYNAESIDGLVDARIELEWSGATPPDHSRLTVSVGDASASQNIEPGRDDVQVAVRVKDVALWWPIGHGEQPLYPVTVSIEAGAKKIGSWESRIGFRTVRVDTAPDADGSPFNVIVNDRLIQVRGANWIPDHAFVTEMDSARYRRRVQDAVDANMNLLRVWGGGIYESHDFYDACDESGVLVWQDFLFACAAYAEEEWLAEEVEAEVRQAITLLSPHPSLIIWNGNNENIWGYADWGWKEKLDGRTWGDWYYRTLFPALVAELDPSRAYSPASPYSFDASLHPNDESHGTMHIWDVWNTHDYSEYRGRRPRFASEFGFQGPPAWSTLVDVVHDEPLEPYGEQMLIHQKAHEGNLKLERGMRGHLPEPRTIDEWHWATQLNQAAAVRFGIEHFRSLSPYNTGSIVWQLNDNWPVVSWAAVDFDEHRKPLWFALRDVYAPRLATFQPREEGLALVVLNDSDEVWTGDIRFQRSTFSGADRANAAVKATVPARGELTVVVPGEVATIVDASGEIVTARLDGFATAVHNAVEVADQALDPNPLDVSVSADPSDPTVAVVKVSAHSYARDVTLLVDRVDPQASVDRGMVTLLAGEEAIFRVVAPAGTDPAGFVHDSVVRHAGQLLSGREVGSPSAG